MVRIRSHKLSCDARLLGLTSMLLRDVSERLRQYLPYATHDHVLRVLASRRWLYDETQAVMLQQHSCTVLCHLAADGQLVF